MLGYIRKNGGPVDALDALDALEEVRKDVSGVALTLMGMAGDDKDLKHAQVELVADVLTLSADELEIVAGYFEAAAK